jgi:Di-haem oxidoreductase, putative peroxidase
VISDAGDVAAELTEETMKDRKFADWLKSSLWCGALAVLVASLVYGCSYGVMTETIGVEEQRDYSGIATPGSGIPQHPNLHTRATWGTSLSYAALGYENASAEIQALFDFADPAVVPPPSIEDQSPLQFFGTPHTDEEGVGPLFNQRACIGCHNNSVQNQANFTGGDNGDGVLAGVNMVNTPVSRAGRQGVTDYPLITKLVGNPPTTAFTLYGDYNPASGVFDPLSIFGGPLQHDDAIGYCAINTMPSISIDPNLAGGIDPVTGLSPLGERRVTGERAAPPYVARGLMEAIYYGDILTNEDPQDQVNTYSSLPPRPDPQICPSDCISGRHNESAASQSFIGGDPLVRVGRFGLRGAGTTLLQFDVGGTQGEIGLTSPFAPFEQPNVNTTDPNCIAGGPTPNITAARVLTLRDLIRNIAPPVQASSLYEDPPTDADAIMVQAGAVLFGLDLTAFRARMTSDDVDPSQSSNDTNQALANDRMLGCSTCHVPVFRTGVSPAQIGGTENLSNRWAPIFSDLLIHQNPEVPYYFEQQWYNLLPQMIDPASCNPTCDPTKLIEAPYPLPGNVSRDLTDYALVPNVTGLAAGSEFRTAPLMGLGKVGPPFGHDARIYLNVTGEDNYPGQPPNLPARMQFTSADGGTVVDNITTVDQAVLGAIEMHDLPAPPINPSTHAPDYDLCPIVPSELDICSRASQYRGEARNTMEKFHALTQAQQLTVVRFLEAL